jgi:hypothetical protein
MTRRITLPSARWLVATAVLVAAMAAFAGQAHASTSQESIVQDDRVLQNFGSVEQNLALDDIKSLGATTIHALVNWNTLAPDPTSGSMPDGFVGSDPHSYDPAKFNMIDQLVRGAQQRGLSVILTPAGPGPVWANGKDCQVTERRRAPKGTCRPDAKLYGQFVTALARRYSGAYIDEDGEPGVPLPRVSRWSIWNEPNLNSWIYPSIVSIRGKRVPVSAKIYRDLVYAGGNALRRNGHKSDQILLGETAPIGQGTSRTSPVTFYQALFCVDAKGKRLKGGAARNLGCSKRIKRLPVTGIAHHPYTKSGTQPPTAKQHSYDVSIAGIGALQKVLKQGAKAKAISSSASSHIYFTEFGVSSSPPAKPKRYGVSLARQAEYINEFEYMSYVNPAVRSVSQFQLEDDAFGENSVGGKLTFQTGLRYTSPGDDPANPILGPPKPAYQAYKVPLFVVDKGKTLTIWGGVRGVSSGRVKVLNGKKAFRTVKLRRGYFMTTIKKRKGSWQLSYGTLTSRVAKPEKMKK